MLRASRRLALPSISEKFDRVQSRRICRVEEISGLTEAVAKHLQNFAIVPGISGVKSASLHKR